MDLEDVARQRLVAGGHTANRPGSEHAVVARGEKPAVQRLSEDPAYRRDPETASVLVNVRGHQRRVGSSRAAKKAEAVIRISFAFLNCATSARRLLSSAIASSADRFVSAAAVASDWLRHRLSDSGAIPRSFHHLSDRLRLRQIRGTRLRQQPDGLRLELARVSRALCHGSIISHRVRGNAEQKSGHIIIH